MAFGLNRLGMKTSLKERAAVPVHFVVGFCVTIEYELRQVSGWFFAILPQQQVIVVWHEAIGNNSGVIYLSVFLKFFNNK